MITFNDIGNDNKKRYQDRHREVVWKAAGEWFWSGNVTVTTGTKDIEKEIAQLEHLSLLAYKAMKFLKSHVADQQDLSED